MKRWVKNLAAKTALESIYPKYQHGAVIERGGNVIGKGCNVVRYSDPDTACSSTHAEVAALNEASTTEGADLYVARVTGHKLALSRPCKKCEMAIRAAGIKRVYYSIANNEWAELILS